MVKFSPMESMKMTNPVIFEIVIPKAEIEKDYQKRLTAIAAQAEIKGFRKGKAPVNLVEEKIGKSKIYSDVMEAVLPVAYQKEVAVRKLAPMIAPRVKPLNIKEKEDWKFEIMVVVKPEVELGEYEKEIAKEEGKRKKEDNKTKDKQDKKPENPEIEQNRKMGVVFDTLLKTTKVELPQMLVDEEVNLRLTQLVDQVSGMGMTIDQYLRAKNLTNQQIRVEYEKTARDMLKLNLILDAVAAEQKFAEKDRISKAVNYLLAL